MGHRNSHPVSKCHVLIARIRKVETEWPSSTEPAEVGSTLIFSREERKDPGRRDP